SRGDARLCAAAEPRAGRRAALGVLAEYRTLLHLLLRFLGDSVVLLRLWGSVDYLCRDALNAALLLVLLHDGARSSNLLAPVHAGCFVYLVRKAEVSGLLILHDGTLNQRMMAATVLGVRTGVAHSYGHSGNTLP